MVRKIFLFINLSGILLACTSKTDYNPDKQLSPVEKDKMLSLIIRYVAKEPENISSGGKFDKKFGEYYEKKISEARLEQYYKSGDRHYFLVSQPAPSLIKKRHATGGLFKFDGQDNLAEYEEIFRTWKMVPDTLRARSYFLFNKMVLGESLEPYYTKNSKGIEYIEFPDDKTYYDKDSRNWRVKL